MSSTILYKFRAGTTFEALPLPGSAARLFDVKKGICVAKKVRFFNQTSIAYFGEVFLFDIYNFSVTCSFICCQVFPCCSN